MILIDRRGGDKQVDAYLLNNVAVFGLEICGAAEMRPRRVESLSCFD